MISNENISIVEKTLTLARRTPVLWDIRVESSLPGTHLSRRRLARQIRQDMWRACQNVRGFAPIVEVQAQPDGYTISAGGQVDARSFPRRWMEERIGDVLQDNSNRQRWISHARYRNAR